MNSAETTNYPEHPETLPLPAILAHFGALVQPGFQLGFEISAEQVTGVKVRAEEAFAVAGIVAEAAGVTTAAAEFAVLAEIEAKHAVVVAGVAAAAQGVALVDSGVVSTKRVAGEVSVEQPAAPLTGCAYPGQRRQVH